MKHRYLWSVARYADASAWKSLANKFYPRAAALKAAETRRGAYSVMGVPSVTASMFLFAGREAVTAVGSASRRGPDALQTSMKSLQAC